MATKIVTKNSSTAGAAPTATDLVQGELAVNVADGRLYTEDNAAAIVELGVNPATEITANAGIALPDSQKATFGANDDLQIYHDGSDSVIAETGVGNLALWGNNIKLLNSAGTETMLDADPNGAVTLYYNDVTRLATSGGGIDVTGTATMDGLTVNSTTPQIKLNETDVTDENTQFIQASGSFRIRTVTDAGAVVAERMRIDHGTGDISFYEDTGTTPKLFWDSSAESLGIGTSSPAYALDLTGAMRITGSRSTYIDASEDSSAAAHIFTTDALAGDFSQEAGHLVLQARTHTTVYRDIIFAGGINNASDLMRITGEGNVGIGTSSPTAGLTVSGTGVGAAIDWTNTTASTGRSYRWVSLNNGTGFALEDLTSGSERVRIDASGNLLVGTSVSPATLDATAVRYGVGVQAGSLSSVVVCTGGTATAVLDMADAITGDSGAGMWQITVTRDGASYGQNFTGIFGCNDSTITLYSTLQASGITATVSGSVLSINTLSTDQFMTNAIPLSINA